jgi:FAD/FMN-containing dehydrogenase
MATPNRPASETISRLKDAAGTGGWSEDPAELAPHLVEWRDRYRGTTAILLKPDAVPAISRIVSICASTGTSIVPQGGNTGLVGGQIPDSTGTQVLLSLKRLNRIRAIDADAATMTVDAGCILADVQAHAADNGLLFPLSLASEGSATIGGLISTNAGGTGVLAYGNTRALVLGLEAVLPDGSIWNGLRALRKDNTGYDLKQLLIGAEGTLGIVAAAVLKLFPQPSSIETAVVAVPSVAHAIRLLSFARQSGGTVTAFELIPRIGLDFVLRHIPGTRAPLVQAHDWLVLIDMSVFGGSPSGCLQDMLVQAATSSLITDASVAQSSAQREAFWKIRDALSEAQKPEGGSIKHDVSVPISAIPAFLDEATAAVTRAMPGARPVPFGHLGDGNIHYNISQPVDMDKQSFLKRWSEVNTIVHDLVHRFHGSISAEHGIGIAKVDEITRYKSRTELDAMRAIKRALDPHNIMNPGKVVRI